MVPPKSLEMPIRIFTLPFNEETQTFHDDVVAQFCLNKRIHKIDSRFFTRNHQPFWTVAVHYGQILAEEKVVGSGGDNPERQLDDQQKVLLVRLKEWRKEAAGGAGLPVYMIATNTQLIAVIVQKCVTLEGLKLVRGFGKTKIEKYGKPVTDIVKQFYHPV